MKNDHNRQLNAAAIAYSNLLMITHVEGTNDYY